MYISTLSFSLFSTVFQDFMSLGQISMDWARLHEREMFQSRIIRHKVQFPKMTICGFQSVGVDDGGGTAAAD
ncbi:Hypothetical predicted protein [Octopus vulgaris]|uniref:Uncharacterized protein n=1 Tax=Octopus vulgaris TaxID=6645 RepID=A0AA36AQR6_OCTVU|nr:Hypothetical predicted protein [Octopus vulgaris]